MILPWLILFLVICALSLADLHVLNRKPSVHKPSTAMLWFSFYLLLAMAFNAALYVVYNRHPPEIGASGTIRDGHQASFEFLSALLLDLALDLDMVFVFSAVFAHFKTPEELQRRVLLWGVVMTQLVQGPVIFMLSRGLDAPGFGGALRLTLAAVLVVAAFRMILMRRDTLAVESNPLYKLLTRMLPITESGERGTLMTRVQGKYAFTPLVFTLAVLTPFRPPSLFAPIR
jgi:tellurite resistance protein TerC